MYLTQIAKNELDGIIKKIDGNMKKFADKLPPDFSQSNIYSDQLDYRIGWTGSFWTGMVILAKLYNKDDKYDKYLECYKKTFWEEIERGKISHDIGFVYQLYALDAYRLTKDCEYADMAIRAAKVLLHRYNRAGGFIRAWGELIDPHWRGQTIIDCLMNLPLLFSVGQMTGDEHMINAAYNHATAAMKSFRPDGSVYHMFGFNPVTGEPEGGGNQCGYAAESAWSRGQSWAIYGFYLAYMHTLDKKFLESAMRVADYFIANLNDDYIPKWDFKLDASAPSPDALDTSAAAIAVNGLYGMAEALNNKKGEEYKSTADLILKSLIENYSVTFDDSADALLTKVFAGVEDKNDWTISQGSSTWGDYFYMEALMKKIGIDVSMWSVT